MMWPFDLLPSASLFVAVLPWPQNRPVALLAVDAAPRAPNPVGLKKQVDFPEPRVPINMDTVDVGAHAWDECGAWDDMTRHHREGQRGVVASASGRGITSGKIALRRAGISPA